MKVRNVEIKARCTNPQHMRDTLLSHGARYIGKDHQIDTYYETGSQRLKLRQGNIENALIAYARPDTLTPKRSDVLLYKTHDAASLQDILDQVFEIKCVVDKQREIYFIDNIKFHLDCVKGLGNFVEIEAIDETGALSEKYLRMQCSESMSMLSILNDDLITHSYSDMILLQV